jgi:hypothetical protein
VLARYALGPGRAAAGTAAAKAASEEDDHGADFIRGLLAKEQLWRTSGFRFSWLLSRRELDLLTDRDRAEFGRNMAYYWAESKRMRDFIRRAMLFGSTAWSSMVLLFFAEMLLTFVVPHDAQFFKDPIGRLFRDSSDFLPPILAVSWLLAAFMIAGPWGHDRPYGLRFSEALYFLLAGPAMPTIRDFPLRTRERTGKPAGD